MDTITVLDSILKYLSIITLAGAAISFVIGLIRWLDQRNREEKGKRYEQFTSLIELVAVARDTKGNEFSFARQLAAVYELQNFREYRDVSIPVLKFLKEDIEQSNNPDKRNNIYIGAINQTLDKINSKH